MVEPELDLGLQGVELDGDVAVRRPGLTGSLDVGVRVDRSPEPKGGSSRLGLGMLPLPGVLGAVADAGPAPLGQLLLPEYGRQLRQSAVQREPVRVAGAEGVADRRQKSKIVAAQEAPAGGREEAHREVDHRQPRGGPMVEGLTKRRQIVARGGFDPGPQVRMKSSARCGGKCPRGCLADEVMSDPSGPAAGESQAANDEFAGRLAHAIDLPVEQVGSLSVCERPCTDGQRGEECARVRAEVAKAVIDEAGWIGGCPRPGKGFHPERRASGTAPQVSRRGLVEVSIYGTGQPTTILDGKRPEFQELATIGRKIGREARAERRGG